MFVWARLPQVEDSLTLAEAAQRGGIMLARRLSPASRALACAAAGWRQDPRTILPKIALLPAMLDPSATPDHKSAYALLQPSLRFKRGSSDGSGLCCLH
jgi:hypothetical protein